MTHKPTGEYKFFESLLEDRIHRDFVHPRIQIVEIGISNMAHVLSKKHYHKFRLYSKNIQILTEENHRL